MALKVRYNVGNAVVEVEGKNVKDAFTQLSGAVEVFGNSECRACSSKAVVPNVRENGGYTYYEMRCTQCGATLSFGQKKEDGTLFPKRKDKSGEYLENGGWVRYRKQDHDDSPRNRDGDEAEPF